MEPIRENDKVGSSDRNDKRDEAHCGKYCPHYMRIFPAITQICPTDSTSFLPIYRD